MRRQTKQGERRGVQGQALLGSVRAVGNMVCVHLVEVFDQQVHGLVSKGI